MTSGLVKVTQIALGSLIFFASTGAVSASKIIGKITPPPGFDWGDWGSSGTLPDLDLKTSEYEPSYSLLYQCQMQITDQVDRRDSFGRNFWSVAIAEFNFNDTVRAVTSENLKWFHKAVYREREVAIDTNKALPFSTNDQRASLQILRGIQIDDVKLQVSLRQKIGSLLISETAERRFSRIDEDINIEKELVITSLQGSILPSTLVRVLCQRKL